MTRAAVIAAIGFGLLTACGADGEPEPVPQDRAAQPATDPGLRVSGTARVGVSVSRSGVHPSGTVSLGRGPVTLSLGF